MSDLQRLKANLNSVANDAKATAGSLSGFKSKFSQAVGRVQATIGGSAQRTDQQIIQTLRAAEKQVDAAVKALQSAAQAAQGYASKL